MYMSCRRYYRSYKFDLSDLSLGVESEMIHERNSFHEIEGHRVKEEDNFPLLLLS